MAGRGGLAYALPSSYFLLCGGYTAAIDRQSCRLGSRVNAGTHSWRIQGIAPQTLSFACRYACALWAAFDTTAAATTQPSYGFPACLSLSLATLAKLQL